MTENRCRFCYEEYQLPFQVRFCEERHLTAIQNIPMGAVRGIEWIGLRELKRFVGHELATRIEKAVLGTKRDTRHSSGQTRGGSNKGIVGRVWWKNPNLQDVPVLISLGIPPRLLEHIERVERECERHYTPLGIKSALPRLRLQGLSSEPKKIIAKLI